MGTQRSSKPTINPVTLLCTGALTVCIAVMAQVLVVSNNMVYLSHHSTFTEVAVYGLAVSGFALVPILDAVYGIDIKIRIGGILCFAYAAAITLAEHFEAAKSETPPEWTVAAATYLLDDAKLAAGITWALPVISTFLVVEFLGHFAGHGVKIMHDAHHKMTKQSRRKVK